jgi:hypothetical protein
MEQRINARFDRAAIDAADRHMANVARLGKLESAFTEIQKAYWEAVGISKVTRFLWGFGGAVLGSFWPALIWLKEHLR